MKYREGKQGAAAVGKAGSTQGRHSSASVDGLTA